MSWDEENIYWEKDTAFSTSGVEESAKREEFNCQTRKVSLDPFLAGPPLVGPALDLHLSVCVSVCVSVSLLTGLLPY